MRVRYYVVAAAVLVTACGGGGDASEESTSPEPSVSPTSEPVVDTTATAPTGPDIENPDALPWMRDAVSIVGTSGSDVLLGVAPGPDGSLWISGHTDAAFAPELGGSSAGLVDALLLQYDPVSEITWRTFNQFGTPESDAFLGVTATPDGGAVAVGYSKGEFATANYGINDIIAVSVGPDGRERWRVQLGGPDWDRGYSVVANDDGSVFLGGYTFGGIAENFGGTGAGGHDAVVAKVSSVGEIEWVRSIGTDDVDWGQSMTSDGRGGVVIVGYTQGDWSGTNAGARDAFITRVDSEGNEAWTVQLGTEGDEWLQGVTALDDGTIVAVGFTAGAIGWSNGDNDILVVRVSPDGELLGANQMGTSGDDRAFGVVAAPDGGIVISGSVSGQFGADSVWSGMKDAFIAGLDASGDLQWVSQWGSDADDDGYGIALVDGHLWFVGVTAGAAGQPPGTNVSGPTDAWITVYTPI